MSENDQGSAASDLRADDASTTGTAPAPNRAGGPASAPDGRERSTPAPDGPERSASERTSPDATLVNATPPPAGDDEPAGDGEPGTTSGTRPRRRWRAVALLVSLALLLLAGAVGVGSWWYARSIEQRISTVDAFAPLPEAQRPAKVATQTMNILILGTDSVSGDASGARTDTIILAHLPADRDRAHLIAIPRDTWTWIPPSADGRHGGTTAKINAAYAWGGVPLLVRTVEDFTGVRIDHVVVIDFAGFKKIIDAIGGIDVTIDRDFTSVHPPYRRFTRGVRHLDGDAALDYARQRKQFDDGDFSRIRHQQAIIAAVLDRAAQRGVLAEPRRLNELVQATADAVRIDRTMSVVDLAWELRNLRSSQLTMLTSPSAGTGMVGEESVVFPDQAAAEALYAAVRHDDMDRWLAANPD